MQKNILLLSLILLTNSAYSSLLLKLAHSFKIGITALPSAGLAFNAYYPEQFSKLLKFTQQTKLDQNGKKLTEEERKNLILDMCHFLELYDSHFKRYEINDFVDVQFCNYPKDEIGYFGKKVGFSFGSPNIMEITSKNPTSITEEEANLRFEGIMGYYAQVIKGDDTYCRIRAALIGSTTAALLAIEHAALKKIKQLQWISKPGTTAQKIGAVSTILATGLANITTLGYISDSYRKRYGLYYAQQFVQEQQNPEVLKAYGRYLGEEEDTVSYRKEKLACIDKAVQELEKKNQ